MNRSAKSGFLIMIIVFFSTIISFADSGSIKINLDGTDVVSDSPPVIVDGRTLIPARAVFEAMGGAVNWDEASREITVTVNKVNVKLVIDSRKAYINGTEMTLDVPARIIKNRTMIPVRFVSESVGCQVSWDDKNRIVSIVSPTTEEDDLTMINNIELSREGNKVIIDAEREITDFTSFKMINPSRLVFDIQHAKLDMTDGAITTDDNPFFKAIRYSQYTKDSVRIVADLTTASSGTVSRSDSMRTAYMTFEVYQPGDDQKSINPEEQAILDQYGLSAVTASAWHKLVVIDPGHGGADTGSRGFENGVAVLNEKDVNLDIALRLQKMLEAAGARIYMIRTEDTTIPLYDRQDTANNLSASLYVSIHNNSYTNSTPSGTEVHYHGKDDPPKDGISAMELAQDLQSTLTSNLGLPNRGAKVSPELAVLRRTIMPAIIIEGAFLSNPNDLNYMKTDDFREKYAMSVATCIIEALNDSIE
ncbi:MAG TPA: N-acetylmuramoyl-L-alanine amidase family protein [Anaerovoracaceae bacterium]|nr:N-acetylmuramoyl-L-alanine amidase family protein [Anaerovoracaceae bacterium]